MDQNELFSKYIKKDYVKFVVTALVLIIVFKIVFYKEDFATVVRTALSLLFLFTLPGMLIVSLLSKNVSYIERLLFGTFVGAALSLLISYNLNQFGISMKYSNYVYFGYFALVIIVYFYFKNPLKKIEENKEQ